jgi:ubiquinone/menaquinone biosynthesis C-methylase UbiE
MTTFDPIAYKATTREQWESAAEAWHRWGPVLEEWLAAATQRMLDAANVDVGSQVLDVAAGAGGQTLAAARRAGAEGRVVATDISPAILAFAAQAAARAGVAIETRELDGEAVDGAWTASFDAVISRLGLIYFPDQQRALKGMRQALRQGGRMAAIVYSTPERNGFFSVPVRIIRTRAKLAPPAPGQPGPFSLGGPGVLQAACEQAGFRDVSVQAIEAPLRLPSAAECVRFERESFGALHQMLSSLPAEERPSVWHEIEDELGRFETGDGFVGPCELLVVAASR